MEAERVEAERSRQRGLEREPFRPEEPTRAEFRLAGCTRSRYRPGARLPVGGNTGFGSMLLRRILIRQVIVSFRLRPTILIQRFYFLTARSRAGEATARANARFRAAWAHRQTRWCRSRRVTPHRRGPFGRLGRVLGNNAYGQCTVPSGVGTPANPVVQVAAGGYHTVAVLSDGSVACWGYNATANARFRAAWAHRRTRWCRSRRVDATPSRSFLTARSRAGDTTPTANARFRAAWAHRQTRWCRSRRVDATPSRSFRTARSRAGDTTPRPMHGSERRGHTGEPGGAGRGG